ncbi:MAG: hypothetical protein QOF76_1762, partial [Solirubrobacteraceae bacterium]|nr:hypothetical protein [Solirubrobacteraceae bacterium]
MMRTGGPTSFCGGVLCVLAALAGPAHAQSTSAECTPRSQPIQRGLTVVKTERRDAQTTIYYFRSAAVGPDATPDGIVRARVVLPRRYASEPTRRFPVVYHLHGTNNSATTWTDADVEKYIVGDTPVILVMPDGGNYGFYTDHYGSVVGTTTQPPAWDTFHNLELVPWIDAHLRTTGRHAIAGSSMGGFGSMAYPERHPGLYDAAASLSGALDIELAGTQPVLYAAWGPCVWGNPVTDADNWHANNPTEHVDKLKGVSLYVSSGNGLPGEHDDLGSPPGTAPTLEV